MRSRPQASSGSLSGEIRFIGEVIAIPPDRFAADPAVVLYAVSSKKSA